MQPESREMASGLLFALRDELDRWLGTVRGGNGTWAPPTDMYEDDGELYIEMELPGIQPGEVEILAERSQIRMRATCAAGGAPESVILHERRRGSYERTLELGEHWDGRRTRAEFEFGLLTLRVPAAPEPEGARRISLDGGRQNSTGSRTGDTIRLKTAPEEAAKPAARGSAEPEKETAPELPAPPAPGSAPILIGGPITDRK